MGEAWAQRVKLGMGGVLPNLEGNIKCENSLIGPDFYDVGQIGLFDGSKRNPSLCAAIYVPTRPTNTSDHTTIPTPRCPMPVTYPAMNCGASLISIDSKRLRSGSSSVYGSFDFAMTHHRMHHGFSTLGSSKV